MTGNRLQLAQAFSESHPKAAADILNQHPRPAAGAFLRSLDDGAILALIGAMMPSDGAPYLRELPDGAALDLLCRMPAQRAANLIRLLPAALRQKALATQTPIRRSQIRLYLRQAKGIVGAWIESDVLVGTPEETVDSLQKKFVHYKGEVPAVYILDSKAKIAGAIGAVALIAAEGEARASDLLKPVAGFLRAQTPIETAISDSRWRTADILPVVGANDEFVGIVKYGALRLAVDDLSGETPPEMSGASILGVTDAWFLGLSDIVSASMGGARQYTAGHATEERAAP